MAYNLTQARKLLNVGELKLFESSRVPALGKLSATQLAKNVERSRTLRDKQRDLLKKQRLASRSATGSKGGTSGDANARTKQKAELFVEVLQRFDEQAKKVRARDKAAAKSAKAAAASAAVAAQSDTASGSKSSAKRRSAKTSKAATKKAASKRSAAASAGKPAAKKATARKATATKAAAKKTAGNKSTAKKSVAKEATTKKSGAPARKTGSGSSATAGKSAATKKPRAGTSSEAGASGSSSKPATRPAAGKSPKRSSPRRSRSDKASSDGLPPPGGALTPEQALANTRALLEAKQEGQRHAHPPGPDDGSEPVPDFMSPEAQAKNAELHAAEIRESAIQGHISSRARRDQAKRDKR